MILDITSHCTKIEPDISTFIHNIIVLIKIAVPIALVLFGMLDLGKGVIAGKEDEIKKGQQNFIKRLIAGAAVFFMIALTQFVIDVVDKTSSGEIWNCANLIMNGNTGKPLTSEEQSGIRNSVIEECCKYAEGQFEKDGNDVSCKKPDKEKYNACYEERMEEVNGGE